MIHNVQINKYEHTHTHIQQQQKSQKRKNDGKQIHIARRSTIVAVVNDKNYKINRMYNKHCVQFTNRELNQHLAYTPVMRSFSFLPIYIR